MTSARLSSVSLTPVKLYVPVARLIVSASSFAFATLIAALADLLPDGMLNTAG